MPVLLVNHRELKPLPKVMWGTACADCNKLQAKWSLDGAEPRPTCSFCYLYQSKWAQAKGQELVKFITAVEVEIGGMFSRDLFGRLALIDDADRILGALVLTSSMFASQDKYAAVARG